MDGGASLCDLGQKPYPLWARAGELTALLSLFGSPSLSPLASRLLGAPVPQPLAAGPRGQAAPTARQAAGGGSRQGGKRQEGQELQELQEPAGPGRLLNWGARPGPASTGPHFHQPPSLLALHCKHSSPTSVAEAPEGGTAADTARGLQKHLTPSLLPGRARRPEDGAGPGFPDSGVTRSGALPAALAGPRLATWINRPPVRSQSDHSRTYWADISRLFTGCPALHLV